MLTRIVLFEPPLAAARAFPETGPMSLTRLAYALLMALAFATPARADDISAAGRGVVRVVTIATADGEVVGFGHGSGFAIAPNRIVTNAHVVELAARFPDNVVIGVVPSEGTKSYRGRLIAYDPQHDLALIEFTGTQLPPLTLFPGPVDDGESVIALGYPGNVDLATAQSAADYIKPLSPVRSQGGFAGQRDITGTQVLLHTASIARGNSGGPLLDVCGRVIGANSAITRAEEGDSSFGFAIADSELTGFLRAAKQPFATTAAPCTSVSERLQQDREAAGEASAAAIAAQQAARDSAARQQQAAFEQARAERQLLRENVMGVAGLAVVLGAMAMAGAGLLAIIGRRTGAMLALGAGLLTVVGGVALFLNRPDLKIPPPPFRPTPLASAAPVQREGTLICSIQPERSRINTSTPQDVTIDWSAQGCVNARTQYAEAEGKWQRILVPAQEQTVSVLDYAPATQTYANRRYLLSAAKMAAARKLRGASVTRGCATSDDERQKLGAAQAAVRDMLPEQPDEWLVYACKAAP